MIRKLAVLSALFASAAAAQSPVDPSELFGVRQSIEHIDISPNGRRIVYLHPGPGRTTLVYVHDFDGGGAPRIAVRSSGAPERFRWCNFVTHDRLICTVAGMSVVADVLTPFSRLVSFDVDGGNPTQLGERSSFFDERLRQYDGAIIDWLPGQDGAVLMARDHVPEAGRIGTRMTRSADGLGVDRVDVRTLRSTRVETPNRNAGQFMSDGRGNVRIMAARTERATGMLGSRTDYLYRTEGSREWRPFGSFDGLSGEGIVPVAIDAGLNAAYALRKLNGRYALYRVKLDGSMTEELVHASEQVDVDDVIRVSRGARVIGVTFAEEMRRNVYFDNEHAALARSLGRAIPNLPLIDFGGASADGNRLLVHAGSDGDAGRYYVYDRSSRNLSEILMARPALENVPTATVRAVSYPAADGTSIPAYLTLPRGGTGRGLPAVILPHGGPAARDEWGFDWLAQYLANQGYAVLQPNYRGSAGYGDQWLQENGFRSWRTSIGDISAGARWLTAQGIAAPDRMAILGWSYGGYAALQAGATEPGLFKAIVAIAPVTDLQQVKDDARHYSSARNVAEYIGSGPHIAQGSPIRNIAAISAPVLLFHGDRDLNVNVTHSQRMDRALREAGKSSELHLYPGLEHDLADSSVRAQMLRRIGAFLAAALPAR